MADNDTAQQQSAILTKEEIREVAHRAAEEAAEEAVSRVLTRLGIDSQTPIEMQRDFRWLRDWRQASESAHKKGVLAIMLILLSGLMGAVWVGLKHLIVGNG